MLADYAAFPLYTDFLTSPARSRSDWLLGHTTQTIEQAGDKLPILTQGRG